MTIRVSKVEAPASQLPRSLLFHCDSPCLEPRLPVAQFGGWDSECDVYFAVPVVRRFDRPRSSLHEEQQHLAFTRLHCAATLAEFFDNAKSKCLLVKTDGARYIAHIQRRFKNAIRFRHNASWLSI